MWCLEGLVSIRHEPHCSTKHYLFKKKHIYHIVDIASWFYTLEMVLCSCICVYSYRFCIFPFLASITQTTPQHHKHLRAPPASSGCTGRQSAAGAGKQQGLCCLQGGRCWWMLCRRTESGEGVPPPSAAFSFPLQLPQVHFPSGLALGPLSSFSFSPSVSPWNSLTLLLFVHDEKATLACISPQAKSNTSSNIDL